MGQDAPDTAAGPVTDAGDIDRPEALAGLGAQRHNDLLRVGTHVVGVLRLDVCASLRVKLVDERR